MQESYARAKKVLTTHHSEMTLIAEALLEYETLDADEIKLLLETHSLSKLKAKKQKEQLAHAKNAIQNTKTEQKLGSKIPVPLKIK